MKLAQHKALVIALALVALAGCRTTEMRESTASTTRTESTYGTPSQQMDQARQMDQPMDQSHQQMGHSQQGMAGAAGSQQRGMEATQPNAVVMNIETVSRSSAMGTGAGATTSGTSGMGRTGAESDRIYRITVRMDDGTTRTLMQERAPSFRPGDRVTVSNNMISQQ